MINLERGERGGSVRGVSSEKASAGEVFVSSFVGKDQQGGRWEERGSIHLLEVNDQSN